MRFCGIKLTVSQRNLIQVARLDNGLKPGKAARLSGISRISWLKIERGDLNPTVYTLIRVLSVVGLPLDQ